MIQIIGYRSCRETSKAIRYMKERGREYQFVDLGQRSLSAGELESIFSRIPPSDCINTESKYYKSHGLDYMVYDASEELTLHNELFKTPILRCKGKAALGFDEAFLREND